MKTDYFFQGKQRRFDKHATIFYSWKHHLIKKKKEWNVLSGKLLEQSRKNRGDRKDMKKLGSVEP